MTHAIAPGHAPDPTLPWLPMDSAPAGFWVLVRWPTGGLSLALQSRSRRASWLLRDLGGGGDPVTPWCVLRGRSVLSPASQTPVGWLPLATTDHAEA